MQSLNLYFLAIPDEASTASMDKWLNSVAKELSTTSGGLRIWLTHVPETATRPFLHAKAFDIVSEPIRLAAAKREEYQVNLGGAPKKHVICRTEGDDEASFEVLLSIALEFMKRSAQSFLAMDTPLAARLLGPSPYGDPFEASEFERYPGNAFEVAHESDEGDLDVEWFVDARWLRAWRQSQNLTHPINNGDTFSRFASLDYN